MRPFLLVGHGRPLTRVKYNREGDLLYTTAKDNEPTVWRASTGERLGTYMGHNGSVWDLDISYHTTTILTGSADNTAKLWDAQNGTSLYTWELPSPVRSVAFSPGNHYVTLTTAKLMGAEPNVYLYPMGEGGEQSEEPVVTLRGHTESVTRILWYPTGDVIITASDDNSLRKWDIETGKQIGMVVAHKKGIHDAQFSKDSQQIITASKDCSARLWDTRSFSHLKTYVTDAPVNSAAISPIMPHVVLGGGQEASMVTTTSDRQGKFEARFFHLIDEEELGRVKGHFGPINTVCFSPDGKSYVSGGEDGFVRLHAFDQEYYERDYD